MIRLHVLSCPHTISTKEYTVCAFTQKVINFCKMFKDQGMYVIHYGNEGAEVECDEHVTVVPPELFQRVYRTQNWKEKGIVFNINDEVFTTFNNNAIVEIQKRKQPHDIILCFFGFAAKPVCDAHSDMLCCEPSIGYHSSFAPYKVYESYSVMHGLQGQKDIETGRYKFYEAVIPSGFDLTEFDFRAEKDDYFLMMGRLVYTKGVDIAAQVTEKIGAKLILAGTTYGPHDCNLPNGWPEHVEYVGYADVEKRKRLMAGAKGLFCPTIYNEPFGYVAIEAMLSGTPIITVDYGGFTETVPHGVAGYRCRTFEQFEWAARNIDTISPYACREWAENNYNFKKIGKMYEEYFKSIINVSKGTGWYTPNPDRTDLSFLTKDMPKNKKTSREVINYLHRNREKINFVQIGAMDGVKFDFLHEYIRHDKWSGVMVEPLPNWFEKLKTNMQGINGLQFECSAISKNNEPVLMYTVPEDKLKLLKDEWVEGCSTMQPKDYIDGLEEHLSPVEVNGITLQTLFDKYNIAELDFIQIDTEGSDYDIFMQLLQTNIRPEVMKIEVSHLKRNKGTYMKWLLEQEGYNVFIEDSDLVAYRFSI